MELSARDLAFVCLAFERTVRVICVREKHCNLN